MWSFTPCQTRYQKYSMLNSLFLTILEIGYPKFQKASGFTQDHPVNNPRTRGFRTSPMCSQILCICEKVPCTSLSLAVGKDWVCSPRDASEFRRSKGYSTNHSGRTKQTVQENIQVRLPTCLTRIGVSVVQSLQATLGNGLLWKHTSSMTQLFCIHYWQPFDCFNLGCHSPLFYCRRNVLLQNPNRKINSPENSFHSCRRVWINPCSLKRSRPPVWRATLCSWTCRAATWKASMFNQAFFFFFCSFLDGLAFRRSSVPINVSCCLFMTEFLEDTRTGKTLKVLFFWGLWCVSLWPCLVLGQWPFPFPQR